MDTMGDGPDGMTVEIAGRLVEKPVYRYRESALRSAMDLHGVRDYDAAVSHPVTAAKIISDAKAFMRFIETGA